MAEIREEFYHGWIIQVTQTEQIGYTFQCCMAGKNICAGDARFYLTPDQALKAGRLHADLESVRLSLISFVRGRLQLLLLNSDEQNALENSIDQYINLAKHQ